MNEHLRDIFFAQTEYEGLPEGSTVGTSEQFVGFSIGFGPQGLLLPEEADALADLLKLASARVREKMREKVRR